MSTETKLHQLAILNDIARSLNRSIDLATALETTLARVAELLGLETGWVWLLHEETNASYLAASLNLPLALTIKPQRMEGSCYCLDIYERGDLAGAENVKVVTCSRLKYLLSDTAGLLYHASIPLYVHGKPLGLLNVASADWRELSSDDLQLLYTIGDLLGIAIERARLYDKSVQLGVLEERNRLAREIHDTLAQGLTAVSLHLESADVLIEAGAKAERTREAVRRALHLTRTNLEAARRSVMDLRAAPLEGRSLVAALRDLVGGVNRAGETEVSCRVVGENQPIPVRLEMGLYRIAQEGLTNALRHAGAGQVWLTLTMTPEWVRLVVEDEGVGFDPAGVASSRFGLTGMNERAKLLGGTLRLETSVGEGTRLEVVVPTLRT